MKRTAWKKLKGKNRWCWAACISVVVSSPCFSIEKTYIGVFGGSPLASSGDTHIPSINNKPPLTSHHSYRVGTVFGIHAGYRPCDACRMEVEWERHVLPMNKIYDAIGAGTVTDLQQSSTRIQHFFVNGYYDVPVFQNGSLFVGVGAGYVDVKTSIQPDPPIPVSSNTFFTEKTLQYNVPGYQGIVGVAFRASERLHWTLRYAYFSTFPEESTGVTNLGADAYLTRQRVWNQELALGLQYHFG